MSGKRQMVPFGVEEINAQVALGTISTSELAADLSIKAHDFIIGQIALSLSRLKILLSENAWLDILIWPLSGTPEVIGLKVLRQFLFRSIEVKGASVATDGNASAIMIRLEDEPVGKISDIDIFSFFPHRVGLGNMFFADTISDPRLHPILIDKDVVERIAVMDLEPL